MSKIFKLFFCIIFVIVITLPTAVMFFSGDKQNISNSEKRELAPKPSFKTEDGSLNEDFFADTDAYFSDNFGFRTTLVNTLSTIKNVVFKTSAEEEIVIGKDDWLFFAKTLDDYTRKNVLSENDIARIEKTIDLINEYAEKMDSKFIFFIAPNKNTIYPEKMPYYYIKGTNASNLELLNKRMNDKPYYINMADVLKNSKSKAQLYHMLDSHWNNLGAAIGFDAVMDKFNIEHTDYTKLKYDTENIHEADLQGMLYPSSDRKDAQVVFDFKTTFEYVSRFKSPEDLTIKTASSKGSSNATIYRDSFCNALLPMFAEQFRKVEFSRVFPYRLNLANKNKSDYIVIELVERNIKNLLLSAPVMEAPEREEIVPESLEENNADILGIEKSGNLFHIYGELDGSQKAPKNVKEIYVSVFYEGKETFFEAFPIYESKLIDESEEVKTGGFSLYVPCDIVDKSNIKVFLSKEN